MPVRAYIVDAFLPWTGMLLSAAMILYVTFAH